MFNQKEYFKKWRQQNLAKMAAYMRQYRKDHPEYVEREYAKRHKPNEYIARKKKVKKRTEF